MLHTLHLGLHLPANLYRLEFLRRLIAFLRSLERRLRHANNWSDRADLGELARQVLESPRYPVALPIDQSWRSGVAVTEGTAGLVTLRITLRLSDDIDTRALQRRIDALCDELEIRMAHPADQHRTDAQAITHAARQLLETPREYADTICSEVGHVPAY